MKNKLTELKASSGDVWEDIKSGVEIAYSELQSSLESAREKLK